LLLTHPSPPCSTPIPYTTLFRSQQGLPGVDQPEDPLPQLPSVRQLRFSFSLRSHRELNRYQLTRVFPNIHSLALDYPNEACFERSEEHTSELQSRFDLVCRLLLE